MCDVVVPRRPRRQLAAKVRAQGASVADAVAQIGSAFDQVEMAWYIRSWPLNHSM